MPYSIPKGKNNSSSENFGLKIEGRSGGSSGAVEEFYELEPAVVTDIIIDKTHPIFTKPSNLQVNIDKDRWPSDLSGQPALPTDKDYSWIGRALVRLIYSNPTTQKDKLLWAYPMEGNVSEYPLVNEIVMIAMYRGKAFYGKKLNLTNVPMQSVDFSMNQSISGQPNTELYSNTPFSGRESIVNPDGSRGYSGVAGKYYKINNKIRSVQRYEGDLIVESRFGQSIRFAAYDSQRANDQGDPKNADYADFGGNPMILIRNRQRKILKEGEAKSLVNSPNPATITGTSEEKNVGGHIKEDINHDGSSIYLTTGQTIPIWKTTCYKTMFGVKEEVSAFQGPTAFKYPTLNGDQITIQSDRMIISSRYGETFHYSKKRYAIVTDDEYTVDAHNQIALTTNTKTVLNSPAIYLGEDNKTDEPVLLGQTTVNLLWDFLEMFKQHVHQHEHGHVDAGEPSPHMTQQPTNPFIQQATALQVRLKSCLSRRVFTTGGGFAPGQNGGSITGGSAPTNIDVGSGAGVPGGWKGASKR